MDAFKGWSPVGRTAQIDANIHSPTSILATPHTPGRRASSSARIDALDTGILDDAHAPSNATRSAFSYGDHASIDWNREYAKDRARKNEITSHPGLRGTIVRLLDVAKPWIVIVGTGIGVGIIAAFIDVLILWLSGLRQGICSEAFYLDQKACCAGLDPGETCYSWNTWPEALGMRSELTRATSSYFVYLITAVIFAFIPAVFVTTFAPFAFHTGVPEIKAILGGYILKGYLSASTLAIKAIGLVFAVSSGLSLGREGPLIHVATCVGNIVASIFSNFSQNEARKREILSAAAAAGISVAFNAPLGGVLFSLEELSSFFPVSVLWQSFVCAVVAAVTFGYVDPSSSGRLVLFQSPTDQIWRGFEVIPWLFLGISGGIYGTIFIRANILYAYMRKHSFMKHYPILEVVSVAFITAMLSYLLIYMRMPTAELIQNLFQGCANDQYGLCDRENELSVVFLLLVTAFAKACLTVITFGMKIPAGVFLPSIAIGASYGRAVGILVSRYQRINPSSFLFSGCPAIADGPCISTSVYAVIGAASALSGVTRMTVSLVVVFFELTGAIDLVLQIMLVVMVSKFTGDFLRRSGIYEAWINLRGYPFMDPKIDYRRDAIFAKDVMTPVDQLVCLSNTGWTVAEMEQVVETKPFRGYPVIQSENSLQVIGYITSSELQATLHDARLSSSVMPTTRCRFTASKSQSGSGYVILGEHMDNAPISLSPDTAMEIVVQLFQRMGLRYVLFKTQGKLVGLLTKTDIHVHMTEEISSSTREDLIRKKRLNSVGLAGYSSPPGYLGRIDE